MKVPFFPVYKHISTLVIYFLASTTVVNLFDYTSLCMKHGCENFSASIRVVKVSKDFCTYHNCVHIDTQMIRNLRVRKGSCKSRCTVACTNSHQSLKCSW